LFHEYLLIINASIERTRRGPEGKNSLTFKSFLQKNDLAALNNNDHATRLQSDCTGTNKLNPIVNQESINSTSLFWSKKNAQHQANKSASLSQLIRTQVNPYLEAIK